MWGPKAFMLLSPKVTVFLVGMIRSFFRLYVPFLIVKSSFMKEGFKPFKVLEISKASILNRLIFMVHLFGFFQ